MNEKSSKLVYTKAFKDDECIAYVWDKTKSGDGLMASARISIYGGSVNFLGDKQEVHENSVYSDEIYSALSTGRDVKAFNAAKRDYKSKGNEMTVKDLAFLKADGGVWAAVNRHATTADGAYVLVADCDGKNPPTFYKEHAKELIREACSEARSKQAGDGLVSVKQEIKERFANVSSLCNNLQSEDNATKYEKE